MTNIGLLCTQSIPSNISSDKVALRWIDKDFTTREFTYQTLDQTSNKIAGFLRQSPGANPEYVYIYSPRTPDIYSIFLGTLKSGKIGSILFPNFGEDALLDRFSVAPPSIIFTTFPYMERLVKLFDRLPSLKKLVVQGLDNDLSDRILSLDKILSAGFAWESNTITPPNQPAILHFTSGSTGKPKGVLHVHGASGSHTGSFLEVFQPEPEDIYWCTADPAWVTGTTYGIIAPFACGITQIQYAGQFDPEIWAEIIQNQKVTLLYTAPTVLRMMARYDDEIYKNLDLSMLKRIYSVGEPLNPVIFDWGERVLGKRIYDTWFQTETGSIMIANRPGVPIKTGSMGKPLCDIEPKIITEAGNEAHVGEVGRLALKTGWPSMFIDYVNQNDAYQSKFEKGYYISGDLAKVDEDGYYYFVGRDDDVINTSGHLVSPFEVENSILELAEVAEVGVIGAPDELTWEKIIAFVTLKDGYAWSKSLEIKIRVYVSNRVSPIASPNEVIKVESIPKNKSGKILRRILRNSYLGLPLGDTSTMEEK